MANTPTDPGDFHILIVDDEAGVREVLYELVTEQGYRVTTVSGGQKALQVLAQDQIDLVITDLMMPGMNGWQLLKLVKQRYDYIPVVVLTGYISEEGEEMLTNSQIDGYLAKPVEMTKTMYSVCSPISFVPTVIAQPAQQIPKKHLPWFARKLWIWSSLI